MRFVNDNFVKLYSCMHSSYVHGVSITDKSIDNNKYLIPTGQVCGFKESPQEIPWKLNLKLEN